MYYEENLYPPGRCPSPVPGRFCLGQPPFKSSGTWLAFKFTSALPHKMTTGRVQSLPD